MSGQGFITVHRKLIESDIWSKPPLYSKVWLWLLMNAQHSEYKGLKRGQLSTTIDKIRDGVSWYVGARIERPSYNQIYKILQYLRKSDESNNFSPMIAMAKATQSILITVLNYSVYQASNNCESKPESKEKNLRKNLGVKDINNNVNNNEIHYGEFIKWFNEQTGKHFKNTEANRKIIRARLNDGFNKKDLGLVVKYKTMEWKDDPDMNKYLRFNTVFAPKHFNDYLNEANDYQNQSQRKSKIVKATDMDELERQKQENLKRAEERFRKEHPELNE
jgi:uncharacterized phage protein (TIGR02220 family)